MFPFNQYPYQNINDLNLDWIINSIKALHTEMDTYTAMNTMSWGGDWDIGNAYKQWTIVSDSGDGYLSIQPVPRNVPITDTNYWVMVANYSALYAAFNARITALESAVPAVDAKIGNLTDLHTNVKTSIVNAINSMIDRRFVFFLDSYGLVRNGVTPFIDKVENHFHKVANDFYSFAVGGAGWVAEGSPGEHAIEVIQNNYSSVSNRNTITDVFLNFGVNDVLESTSDVQTQIVACDAELRDKFPNAKIWYGFMGNRCRESSRAWYIPMVRTCYLTAQALGWATCDGIEVCMHDLRNVSVDNVHPSNTGANVLADFVIGFLEGGHPIYRASNTATITDVASNTYDVEEVIEGDISKFTIKPTGSMPSVSFSTASWFNYGTISDNMLDYNSDHSYPCALTAREFTNAAGGLQMDRNGKCYCKLYNWSTTTITGIQITRTDAAFPTFIK